MTGRTFIKEIEEGPFTDPILLSSFKAVNKERENKYNWWEESKTTVTD